MILFCFGKNPFGVCSRPDQHVCFGLQRAWADVMMIDPDTRADPADESDQNEQRDQSCEPDQTLKPSQTASVR